MADLEEPRGAVLYHSQHCAVGGLSDDLRMICRSLPNQLQEGVDRRVPMQGLAKANDALLDAIRVHFRLRSWSSLQSRFVRASVPRLVLSRSYLREIGRNLALVLGGTVLLVALGAAIKASSLSQGAPLWIPAALLPLLVANALPYLLPASLLTAVVLTYGRMAADGEAVAMRVAGIRPHRVLLPATMAGVLVACASYPLATDGLPEIYRQMRELSHRLRFAALENTSPGSSELRFRGLSMTWAEIAKDGSFRDVVLRFRPTSGDRAFAFDPGTSAEEEVSENSPLRLRAERATMSLEAGELVFGFHGLRGWREINEDRIWTFTNEGPTTVRVDLESLMSAQPLHLKGSAYSSAEIREQLDSKAISDVRRTQFRFTLWSRLSTALSAIPLALLGALLGWRLRRNGTLAAFVAAFSFLLFGYYPLFYLGQTMFSAAWLGPARAAMVPFLCLCGVVLFLTVRRESS